MAMTLGICMKPVAVYGCDFLNVHEQIRKILGLGGGGGGRYEINKTNTVHWCILLADTRSDII